MGKFSMRTSSKVQGEGARVAKAGWYHMAIAKGGVNEQPTDKQGSPLDGFSVDFNVLAGTEASEVGKSFSMVFFNPNIAKSQESQDWSARKQTALLVAAGLITEKQLDSDIEVELLDLQDRQLVMHIQADDYASKDGKEFFQLAFADILHIDDPRVAEKKIPLHKGAIDLLPKEQRRDPKSFDLEKLTGKKQAGSSNGGSSNGNGSSKANTQQPVGAGAVAAAGVSLDDI